MLIPGGKKYLVSTLVLKSGIDFHLADDAELVVSTNRAHYPEGSEGVITANGAQGLKITGTGNINGRALDFMTGYNKEGEIWEFGPFRPKIFVLAACKDLEVRDITFSQAPFWGLHMVGCERVLVDRLKIRNHLDVPNCDGIDPDHCRDVEIRNCDIVCGDDAIVVKSTRQAADYGPCANIHVHDCVDRDQGFGLEDRHGDHRRYPWHPVRALPDQIELPRADHSVARRRRCVRRGFQRYPVRFAAPGGAVVGARRGHLVHRDSPRRRFETGQDPRRACPQRHRARGKQRAREWNRPEPHCQCAAGKCRRDAGPLDGLSGSDVR